jgi:hypothetical protein
LIAAQAQTAATTSQTAAASANFTYVSDDGCILNEVIVFANRTTVVKANTPPRTTAEVMYTRYRYNYCEDADLGTDLGTSSQPVFSGDLNRASLNATINGHTASGSAVTVSFVLMWEGKGGVTRKAGRPPSAPASSARSIHTETLNRNAVVTGSMDERDISDAAVGASLHTTRKTISQ